MTEEQEVEASLDVMDVFLTHTGKRHLLGHYQWGPGPDCTNRYTQGRVISATRGLVNCGRCIPGSQDEDDSDE